MQHVSLLIDTLRDYNRLLWQIYSQDGYSLLLMPYYLSEQFYHKTTYKVCLPPILLKT